MRYTCVHTYTPGVHLSSAEHAKVLGQGEFKYLYDGGWALLVSDDCIQQLVTLSAQLGVGNLRFGQCSSGTAARRQTGGYRSERLLLLSTDETWLARRLDARRVHSTFVQ